MTSPIYNLAFSDISQFLRRVPLQTDTRLKPCVRLSLVSVNTGRLWKGVAGAPHHRGTPNYRERAGGACAPDNRGTPDNRGSVYDDVRTPDDRRTPHHRVFPHRTRIGDDERASRGL